MKPAFHEDYQNPDADPLENYYNEFDFETLYARLGEAQEEITPKDYEALKDALRAILEWLVEGQKPHQIGCRCIALCWVISPAMFDGSPSLSKLSTSLNLNRRALSVRATRVSRKFSIRNHGQSHGWNWKQGDVKNWQTQAGAAPEAGGTPPM